MNFEWSEAEKAYRSEVVAFLEEHVTEEVRGSWLVDTPARIEFVSKMAAKGWLGQGFPEKYGGTPSTTPFAQYILNVELDRFNAPIVGKNVGTIARTILHVGSESLKLDFLPKIFNNEGQWALTYSEPSAGTDLGNISTFAENKGDHLEVNGMKHYITSAHFCDWYWMVVKTSHELPKHKNLSLIIVDANSPGISIAPMYCVGTTTAERTNQVFFDRVKVPNSRIVGELNQGFYYMMQAIDYERFAIIAAAQHNRRFHKILEYFKEVDFAGERPLTDDPVSRSQMARLASRVEVGNMLERLCMCIAAERVPSVEASMNKAWGAMMHDETCSLAENILGPYGCLAKGSPYAALQGYIMEEYLMAGHGRIAAGGVDTAKTIIARRLLGLPNSFAPPVLSAR
ncbi:acyl-CoA dehydrogenase family protein [Haliea sp. E1-2-M8]|uniref:acyl-CoA dehydrogenase family protein n=1 Tax=Haliea sp. E1-2-M8 TaxID=3064706 RepID=UPI00272475C8|nr:acyl-CoA dehydrogenase family protein [Haliea sp. E1-2-M8]MDO8864009.1 acyl-CoA dehydrogenase family protein [Haliea sp. E1-2-M8]